MLKTNETAGISLYKESILGTILTNIDLRADSCVHIHMDKIPCLSNASTFAFI